MSAAWSPYAPNARGMVDTIGAYARPRSGTASRPLGLRLDGAKFARDVKNRRNFPCRFGRLSIEIWDD